MTESLLGAVRAAIDGPTPPDTVTRAAHDNAVSTARTAGHADGVAEGARAERTRIAGIIGSEHADGRSDLARHLAFETDMSPEAAAAALKASPKAQAASSRLDAIVPNPSVTPSGPKPDANSAWKAAVERRNAQA